MVIMSCMVCVNLEVGGRKGVSRLVQSSARGAVVPWCLPALGLNLSKRGTPIVHSSSLAAFVFFHS